MGAGLGLALASMSVGLVKQIPGLALPRLDGLHLNVPAVSVSIGVVVLTSMLLAVLPASMLSGLECSSGLRSARTETGKTQRRPFSALIVAEIACAVVLTVCAGLLLRSFVRIQSVELGFQPTKVLSAYLRTTYFGPEGYPFWRTILSGVASLPGTKSAAVSDCMPGAHAMGAALSFDDRPNDSAQAPSAEGCWISADFFPTLGASLVRSAGDDPALLANSVRGKIQSLYPNQPLERITVMREVVSRTLAQRTYSVGLMTAFAGLALLLCGLGIYGVVSYVTLQRTREFGIRMALGASRQDVLRNVLHQGGSLVAVGIVLGVGISLLVTRALSQLLFETAPLDPGIFFSAAFLLGAIGGLASLLPGIRASQLDPRVALNTE